MELFFTVLTDVNGVNYFKDADEYVINQDKDLYIRIYIPCFGGYLRYIPESGATIALESKAINSVYNISGRLGIHPYLDDRSIVKFVIGSSDFFTANGIKLKLSQGIDSFIVKPLTQISVAPKESHEYYC